MNKRLSLLLLLFSLFAQAQDVNETIRNLKADLKNHPRRQKTASIYSDLTWYYSNVSIDSALHYGGKAIIESKKLGDSTLLAQVYSDVGAAYFRKGDFESSKANYLMALKIRKNLKDYSGMAKVNINLGSIYGSKQQYRPAVKAYLDAINYFENIPNNEAIVYTTKENLGYLFREMKNFPKAIEYISETIAYEEKSNQTDKLCLTCLNLGNVYLEMKDTLKAMQCYQKKPWLLQKNRQSKSDFEPV